MYGSGNRTAFQRMFSRRSISAISSQETRMSSPRAAIDSRNTRIGSAPCSSITSWGWMVISRDFDIARPSGMRAWPCIITRS